jgi:hypothetical protein
MPRAGEFQHQNQNPIYRWGKCDSASGKQVWWVFCVVDFSELKCSEQVDFNIKIKTLFIDGENTIQHRESNFGGFLCCRFFRSEMPRAGEFQHQNQNPIYRWGKCDSASGK